jgi:MFS family permease
MAVLPKEGMVVPLLGLMPPWRLVFLIIGLPGLVMALLIWTIREPLRRGRRNLGQTSLKEALRFMRERWRFYAPFFSAFLIMQIALSALGAWGAAYMMRKFGLSISQVGVLMAACAAAPAGIGTVAAGALADRWFSSGRKDAHIRLIIIFVIGKLGAALLMLQQDSLLPAVALLTLSSFFIGFTGVTPAVLQLVTPNEYRGQASSAYLFCSTLFGVGLGPPLVGLLTTYVYRDDAMIGSALATIFMVIGPLGVLLFWLAMKPMRLGITEAETWQSARG